MDGDRAAEHLHAAREPELAGTIEAERDLDGLVKRQVAPNLAVRIELHDHLLGARVLDLPREHERDRLAATDVGLLWHEAVARHGDRDLPSTSWWCRLDGATPRLRGHATGGDEDHDRASHGIAIITSFDGVDSPASFIDMTMYMYVVPEVRGAS